MPHQIAITGHRKLLNQREVREKIAFSLQYFLEKYQQIIAVSALAEGADTIFAEEAARLNIPVRYILPFALQEYKKDFKGEALSKLESIIAANGNRYAIVSELKTADPNERNEAYLAVGKKLVDDSDILLAVWDGKPAAGVGGTEQVITYANNTGKETHIIKGERDTSIPAEDDRQLTGYDSEAMLAKKRFTRVWSWGLCFAVLAVAFFAIGLNFSENHRPEDYPYYLTHNGVFILASLEIICLSVSAWLLIYKVKSLKDTFLDLRRKAEVLRVKKYFKEAQIPLNDSPDTDLLTNHDPAILQGDALQQLPANINLPSAKRTVWILAQDQINYHKRTRKSRLENYQERLHFWFEILKKVFFSAVALKFLLEFQEFMHIHFSFPTNVLFPFLNCIVIVLPCIYAALEGVSYFGEYKKNIAISDEIMLELEKCKVAILSETENQNEEMKSFLSEAKHLRQTLEIENSEWVKRLFDFHFGPVF